MSSPIKPSRDGQVPFSQVAGNPTFRDQAINAVAMIPLLSSPPSRENSESCRSFKLLLQSLERYANAQVSTGKKLPKAIEELESDDDMQEVDVDEKSVQDFVSEVLLVVPMSQLTRPGDWRYEKTPLRNFHWSHGCQRLVCFDGRPDKSRRAHDRLLNHSVTREWIDLCPSRRTAAVVGVLNLKDIEGVPDGLKRAEAELQQWAERYSTPPYEVSAHGRSFARDGVVQRLFVFDSFREGTEVDLSSSRLGSNLVAFPPSDEHHHSHMMDLHLNVVVNDLAVAVFRQLEIRIRESDTLAKERSAWRNFGPTSPTAAAPPTPTSKSGRGLQQGPPSDSAIGGAISNIAHSAARAMRRSPTSVPPQLLTPMDTVWDLSEVSPKDADAMRKRDVGRREKMAADLSLLAGSPMDAYERYSKAAELAKQSPDPLWYASALEGCAAAHMSMAEAGGYNVDSYLESNFQLPEEFMAVAYNAPSDSKKTSNPKQTLPAVIFALCEEALNVFNRHEALGGFHAELLLKLAWYCALVEEGHLRCRWGEGPGCYGGDPGEPRRWDKSCAAQLSFGSLLSKDGEDLISLNSLQRIQKFCQFMHRAVCTASLDPLTRADVAATCARLCLTGLQSTRWKFHDGYIITLPRKAAFFTTIAAEALSKYTARASSEYEGSSLWLAATQLYRKDGNDVDERIQSYGWATLRSVVLHALSQQEDPIMREAAAELMLILLSEMSQGQISNGSLLEKKIFKDEESFITRTTADDDSESVASISSRRTTLSKLGKSAGSTRSGFFSNSNQPTSLTVAQAKWAEDSPIPPLKLPLVEELSDHSLANSLVALRSVFPKINLDSLAQVQQRCIDQISVIRRKTPTLSVLDQKLNPLASYYAGDMAPLHVDSATVVKSESHLLLERTKAHGFSGKATGVMATFFNPFENKKKQAEKKIAATLVAEGEEREVEIEFTNRLAVPLKIPSCHLVFNKNDMDRIKAPALSFTLPPKATKFKTNFPFIVVANREPKRGETEEESPSDLFEVIGIRFTSLSRSFFIPINKELTGNEENEDHMVPESASVYMRSNHNKKSSTKRKKKEEEVKPRIEAVPAQPSLQVSFANSQAAIADGTTIPVHLSDGEIFTIPSLRLQNDFGPSGLGTMERLQIIGVGLPGLPDEVLFDTDAAAAAREEDDDEGDSEMDEGEEDEFEELMEEDGLPPLRMKALCESLSLQNINDKRVGEGSRVTFQIAATHDMGNQLANGGNVRIRFRYRGISQNPASEIWRKREVALRIIRVKGPRISSLTFRPDLSWGSSYSELCLSLAQQKARSEMIVRKWGTRESFEPSFRQLPRMESAFTEGGGDSSFILSRVGMDPGVHVASDEIVVLMAVANETNSTILLSNRKGRVGGFSGSPMPTVRVTSGVSVKIPVVIPRIPRVSDSDDGTAMDIGAELVANTALHWKTVVDDNTEEESINLKARQGRVRIPSKCLREIINEHQSFCSRICRPPVRVEVNIGRAEGAPHLNLKKGEPLTAHVQVHFLEWVPRDVIDNLSITMEFACARKNAAGTLKREYVWSGMLRRTVEGREHSLRHLARVCFLIDGSFVVSACAKLSSQKGVEETWWAQFAENVMVS